MVVGASASCMDLELFSVSDKFLQKMDDNEALLGLYPVDDDCRIHVCSIVNVFIVIVQWALKFTNMLRVFKAVAAHIYLTMLW